MLLEVLGEIAHEETKVVGGPLGEGGIGPRLARGGSYVRFGGVVVCGGRRRYVVVVMVEMCFGGLLADVVR